jgi:hypothetical protein
MRLGYSLALMAAGVFDFGDRPGLNEQDALDLAELLARRRNLPAQSLASKLRAQARVDVSRGQVSQDIPLEREELDVLATALAEEPWAQEQEWFEHLRAQVAKARALG